MDFEKEKDLTFAKPTKRDDEGGGTPNIAIIILGIAALAFVGFLGIKYSGGFSGFNSAVSKKTIAFRTNAKSELKEDRGASSRTIAVLKEGTIVSGIKAGSLDGTEWAEVTSVDGAHGFLPLNILSEIGAGADLSQVQEINARIVVSTLINIREQPSLSSNIVGAIDGGTRLIANGKVSSQGEEWFRISFGPDYVGFIMVRFTTPDDDKSAEGFYSSDQVGNEGQLRTIANIQATPFPDGRVIRAMAAGERVWVIGQTKSDDWWYIVRLEDGTQGFILKTAISVSQGKGKWVYPDGTEAPGPNIPQKGKVKAAKPTSEAPVQSDSESVSVDLTPEPAKTESGIDSELKQ